MVIRELLESKKFIAAVMASLIAFAGVKYAGLSIEEALTIVGPLLAYIGAQAVADYGKEAELVRQAGRGLHDKDGD